VKVFRLLWVAIITGVLATLAVQKMGIETLALLSWQWWVIVIPMSIINSIINNDKHEAS
jgi:hypothetical protein